MILNPILSFAKKSLQLEYEAVGKLFDCIDKKFEEVLKILHNCSGRIIVTGVGKSGLIAQKIVATLNSTGTPAVYVHAGDASHGDLGSIQKEDVVLCLSKSGQSSEIDFLIPYLKKQKNTLIAFTSNQDSKLALQSDFVIQIPDVLEADQNNIAPTTSTTLQIILGDIMAVCLMHLKDFKIEDFAQIHPGGQLGKKLNLTIGQMVLQHTKAAVESTAMMKNVLHEITSKRLGATVVLDKNRIVGFITDGDIRRMLEKHIQIGDLTAVDIMTPNPFKMKASTKAVSALRLMNQKKINHLVVCDDHEAYLGIVHILDFTKEGLKDE